MLALWRMSAPPESAPAGEEERDYGILIFKVAALTFAGIFGLLLIAWAVLTVGVPSPEKVCEHKMQLALQASQDAASPAVQSMLDRLRDNCVADKRRRIQLRGQLAYWRYASCVLSSETFAQSELC